MSVFSSDRNLLVGVLGLQMGLINESALIAAMQSWVFRKSSGLEDILLEQRALKEDSCRFLKSLAEQHMRLHGDDAAVSLAKLSSIAPVRKSLHEIGDSDIEQTITRIASVRGESQITDVSSPGTASGFSLPASERFRVLRPHARGGLGQISIAEDRELHREVALKEIQPEFARDASSRSRFLIEAEVTGRLEHPGIVPVYSLGTTSEGTPFYVMRFIRGDSLKDAISQLFDQSAKSSPNERRLLLKKLVRRLVDVCNAIEYAHSRGVLHRDLKPGNIMLGKYGETLVVDWGLARTGAKSPGRGSSEEATFVPLSSDVSSETRMGSVVGTLAYMSPEQAEGRLNDLGPATDVYSLGATLYCILTGQQPVPRQGAEEMIRIVRGGLIKPPREINAGTPAALDAICRKAMATEIAHRYRTASELANELELWLADEPVSAFREPLTEQALRFAQRHRTFVTSTAGVFATAVIALLVINALTRRQNDHLEVARDRAVANLQQSQQLAMTVLTTAEEKLSSAPISKADAYRLRKNLTEKSLETFKSIHAQNPESRSVARDLSRTARISSNLHRMTRGFELADQEIQLSLDLQQAIPESERTTAETEYLAVTYRDLATLRNSEGRLADSASALETARNLIAPLLSQKGVSDQLRIVAAGIDVENIALQIEFADYASAISSLESAMAVYGPLFENNKLPGGDRYIYMLLRAREVFLLKELKELERAVTVGKALLEESRKWAEAAPQDDTIRVALGRSLYWLGESLLMRQTELSVAGRYVAEAVEVLSPLELSENSSARLALGDALRIQSQCFRSQNDSDNAKIRITRSLKVLNELATKAESADNWEALAKALLEQAEVARMTGQEDVARQALQEAKAKLQLACNKSPDSKTKRQLREQLP